MAPGTTAGDVRALARGLADAAKRIAAGTLVLGAGGGAAVAGGADGGDGRRSGGGVLRPVERVAIEAAAGRIAAEVIAPAPPGVPRLVPGQRIGAAQVAWLAAQRDAGAFFLDPTDPTERTVRVMASGAG